LSEPFGELKQDGIQLALLLSCVFHLSLYNCKRLRRWGPNELDHSLLFLLELLNVELKLLAFEDVAIETARLSGAGADACKQVVGVELVSDLRIQLGLILLSGL